MYIAKAAAVLAAALFCLASPAAAAANGIKTTTKSKSKEMWDEIGQGWAKSTGPRQMIGS